MTVGGRWLFVMTLFVTCSASRIHPVVAQETVPGWHSNLDDAAKQAAATGKPLFITFRCVR